jgi:flavin reductase (DIM6/NTAB) family NADH-FMN oxidoreductase RutF
MIGQCPVNMELRLHDVLDYSTHEILVGKLVQTYAEEGVINGGRIDIAKVRLLLFDMAGVQYWSLGTAVGKCWNAGKAHNDL